MAQNGPKMLTDPHFDCAAGFDGSLATIFGYFEPFWAILSHFVDPFLGGVRSSAHEGRVFTPRGRVSVYLFHSRYC